MTLIVAEIASNMNEAKIMVIRSKRDSAKDNHPVESDTCIVIVFNTGDGNVSNGVIDLTSQGGVVKSSS